MWSGWHSAFTHSKHWVKCQLSLLRWLQLPSGKPCSLCYASTLPNSKWTFQKEIFYFNNTFFNTLLWKDFKYVNRIQYNTQERWWGRAERDPALEAQMGIVHLIQPLSNYVTWLLKLSLNLVKGLQVCKASRQCLAGDMHSISRIYSDSSPLLPKVLPSTNTNQYWDQLWRTTILY